MLAAVLAPAVFSDLVTDRLAAGALVPGVRRDGLDDNGAALGKIAQLARRHGVRGSDGQPLVIAALTGKFFRDAGWPDRLANLIERDFAEASVGTIDGWLFARHEIALCLAIAGGTVDAG